MYILSIGHIGLLRCSIYAYTAMNLSLNLISVNVDSIARGSNSFGNKLISFDSIYLAVSSPSNAASVSSMGMDFDKFRFQELFSSSKLKLFKLL